MANINGMKLMKDTGSLTNALLANPKYTEPKVGMDVAKLLWSDRHAYQIITVAKEGKSFIMQRYQPKWIGKCYGDETYQYEDEKGRPLLTNYTTLVKWRYGKWYEVFSGFDGKDDYNPISLSFNYREEYRDPSF